LLVIIVALKSAQTSEKSMSLAIWLFTRAKVEKRRLLFRHTNE
jgi:hypothetical protein